MNYCLGINSHFWRSGEKALVGVALPAASDKGVTVAPYSALPIRSKRIMARDSAANPIIES